MTGPSWGRSPSARGRYSRSCPKPRRPNESLDRLELADLRRMTGRHHPREVARRFIMFLRGCGFDKAVAAQVLAHKERIHAGEIAADDAISLLAPKPYERFETCPKVVSAGPSACRAVGHDERRRRPQ